MDKSRKLGALLGLSALAVALLGVALLLGQPASAGDDPNTSNDPGKDAQGLMSSSLGI